MKKNNQGFTLIELLVVIAIIGLLSTLAIVSLNNARVKSRDARRVSDIKQIQTALELYFNDVAAYPTTPAAGTCGAALGDTGGCCLSSTNGFAAACAGTTYMATVPLDPTSVQYNYTQDSTTSYSLTYTLEGTTGGIPVGAHVATPAGICDDAAC